MYFQCKPFLYSHESQQSTLVAVKMVKSIFALVMDLGRIFFFFSTVFSFLSWSVQSSFKSIKKIIISKLAH